MGVTAAAPPERVALRDAGPADRGVPSPNATVVDREDLTQTVARFVVRPDDGPIPFVPGQYFAVGLDIGGRFVQRPYSTASPSGSRDLEFLVRLILGGALTPSLWRLRPGERVRVGRPKGIFTLVDGDPRTHVFSATGTGIAPFISMIAALTSRPTPPLSIVLHGVANATELAYRDRLAGWQDRRVAYIPVVSRPDEPGSRGWSGPTGRVDAALADLFDRSVLSARDTIIYACGNPAMVGSVRRLATAAGAPPDAMRSEQYWVS
jgi:ferredoxin/flavodoxin---NADP+ reductase